MKRICVCVRCACVYACMLKSLGLSRVGIITEILGVDVFVIILE